MVSLLKASYAGIADQFALFLRRAKRRVKPSVEAATEAAGGQADAAMVGNFDCGHSRRTVDLLVLDRDTDYVSSHPVKQTYRG